MNESEMQTDQMGSATDISGPPCSPAYADKSQHISGYQYHGLDQWGQPIQMVSGTPGYPDISAWPGNDVWDFDPYPGMYLDGGQA